MTQTKPVFQKFLWLFFLAVFVKGISFAQKPNILVIVTDDQGWGDIGYNNNRVYTPNIDDLASKGVKFSQHYVFPTCTPTRVALMTGRYPSRYGNNALAPSNEQVFPVGTPTLASTLQQNGYETYLAGKWHLGSNPNDWPINHGFDHSYGGIAGAVGMYDHRYRPNNKYAITWHRDEAIIDGYENGEHVTDLITEDAVDFINTDRNEPFFMYMSYHAVHTPLDERGPFVDIPTQRDPNNTNRWLNEDDIPWFHDPEGKIQAEADPEKRLLLAVANHLDYAIGQLIDALKESGEYDNTLIFFTSDNGPQQNWPGNAYPDDLRLTNFNQSTPFRGVKNDIYEGGIRVPGFIVWPGKITPRTSNTPVQITDWLPTIESIVGAATPQNIERDGTDLSDLLLNGTDLAERPFYWRTGINSRDWALRYGDWKIARSYSSGGNVPQSASDWELYNIATDIDENNNLANQQPAILQMLHEMYLEQRSKDFDFQPAEILTNCNLSLANKNIQLVNNQGAAVGTINEGGLGITINGNGWNAIEIPQNISSNTLLQFEFKSTQQGEEHSIGFTNNISNGSALSGKRYKLYGTQNVSTSNANQGFSYTNIGNWQTFTIPLGQYLSGEFNYIAFVNDNDANPNVGNSSFRNIKIGTTEDACSAILDVSKCTVDLSTTSIGLISGQGNSKGNINEGGFGITISGNGWNVLEIPQNINANTVLKFEFKSTQQGEEHAIGFTNNISSGSVLADKRYKLYGTQNVPTNNANQDFSYTNIGNWQTFTIPLGQYLSGDFDYIAFVNDNDANPNVGNASFRNISIGTAADNCEETPVSSKCTIDLSTTSIGLISGQGNSKGNINEGGFGITINGNGWNVLEIPQNITANTVLKFDFKSTQQGEEHGIGFTNSINNGGVLSAKRYKLYGTQNVPTNKANQAFSYTNIGNWQTFTIPLGEYLSGNFNYIAFVNDNDANPNAGNTSFRNISIGTAADNCEETPVTSTCTIDLSTTSIDLISGQGSTKGSINEGGFGITINGNGWNAVEIPQAINANTVLKFDFKSTQQGEEHGIGFTNNISNAGVLAAKRYKLYGTQSIPTSSANQAFSYTNIGNWQTFTIPLGQYLTGNFDYIAFVNDNDANPNAGNASFRNVQIVNADGSCNLTPAQLDVYLVYGQSNAAGRAPIEVEDELALSSVQLFNGADWIPAENPLNIYSTIKKTDVTQRLGPGYTFGRTVNEITGRQIGLVVNAKGGASINELSNDYYESTLNRLNQALSTPGAVLKGIVWHQGEADKSQSSTYLAKLELLINKFRADLGKPNLPFIAGQISHHFVEPFNTVIKNLPNQVQHTDYVATDDLTTTDKVHFDTESQRILGVRYAIKMLPQVYQLVNEDLPSLAEYRASALTLFSWREQNEVALNWVNDLGSRNSYFQIEKSTNGIDFSPINLLTSSLEDDLVTYEIVDKNPSEGLNFYRIKLIQSNGAQRLSNVSQIQYAPLASFGLFPNPAKAAVTIDLKKFLNQAVSIQLVNHFGQTIYSEQIDYLNTATHQIDLSNYTNGFYQVWISQKNSRKICKKLIIANDY